MAMEQEAAAGVEDLDASSAARERWQKHGKYAIELMRMWHRLQQSTALSGSAETYQREVQRTRARDGDRTLSDAVLFVPNCTLSAGHGNYLRKLRSGLQAGIATDKKSRASKAIERLKREQERTAHVLSDGNVVFEHEAEQEDVHYTRQGDLSLHTAESLAQRCALRSHPKVVAELQTWWEAAQRSMRESAQQQDEMQASNGLDKKGYTLMMRRVYRCLLDDFEEQDADQAIAADWASDCRAGESLSRELFMDAHFELCDTWTRRIDADEYATWLRDLFKKVTIAVGPERYIWCSEVECRYAGESLGAGDNHKPLLHLEEANCNGAEQQPSLLSSSGTALAATSSASGRGGAADFVVNAFAESTSTSIKRRKATKREKKRNADLRRKAAVALQCGFRRLKCFKEVLAMKKAAMLITRRVRARQKRKSRAAVAAAAATARLSGSSSSANGSTPWSSPGKPGVKQRWALRTASQLRPRVEPHVAALQERDSGGIEVGPDGIIIRRRAKSMRGAAVGMHAGKVLQPISPPCAEFPLTLDHGQGRQSSPRVSSPRSNFRKSARSFSPILAASRGNAIGIADFTPQATTIAAFPANPSLATMSSCNFSETTPANSRIEAVRVAASFATRSLQAAFDSPSCAARETAEPGSVADVDQLANLSTQQVHASSADKAASRSLLERFTFAAVPVRDPIHSTYANDLVGRVQASSSRTAHIAWNVAAGKRLLPRSSSEPVVVSERLLGFAKTPEGERIGATRPPRRTMTASPPIPANSPTAGRGEGAAHPATYIYDKLKAAFVEQRPISRSLGFNGERSGRMNGLNDWSPSNQKDKARKGGTGPARRPNTRSGYLIGRLDAVRRVCSAYEDGQAASDEDQAKTRRNGGSADTTLRWHSSTADFVSDNPPFVSE